MENLTKEQKIEKINKAEKLLREAENLRVVAKTKEEQYNNDLLKCEEELKKLGTTPEDAENKLKELDDEMNSLLEEIEKNLPMDVLKKYGKA